MRSSVGPGERIARKRARTARRLAPILLIFPVAALVAAVLAAQVPGNFGDFSRAGWFEGTRQREMLPSSRLGFNGCWLVFDRVGIDGQKRGWETDYPLAVRNFMQRLGEFTTTTINRYSDGAMADGVVRATDEGLFECPFLFTSDIGTATFSVAEVERLREYFEKGGLLWTDDSWGRAAIAHWEAEIGKILPEHQLIELPAQHPLMSTFYFIDKVPQMPSIQSWDRTGRDYEDRGFDSQIPSIRAIVDDEGRALVVTTHNTDIGDGMEREGVNQNYFYRYSPRAYAMAVNIAVYSMTR